jgi:hypothetical protein
MTCKCGALTQDGGRSSSSLVNTSVMLDKQTDALMLLAKRTLKDRESTLLREPTMPTKGGELFTKTNPQPRRRDLTRTSGLK